MISSQVIKCWSCSEIPNGLPSTPYIIYKSAKMVSICREHKHKLFPISFHDYVKCVLCNVNNLDPNDLGSHYHHPLVGMKDWQSDYDDSIFEFKEMYSKGWEY
jgi:hypothetical protein